MDILVPSLFVVLWREDTSGGKICKKISDFRAGNNFKRGNFCDDRSAKKSTNFVGPTMLGAKRPHLEAWSRTNIVICHCPSLPYKHVHCPCNGCRNAAVSTSTEYTHWKHAEALR